MECRTTNTYQPESVPSIVVDDSNLTDEGKTDSMLRSKTVSAISQLHDSSKSWIETPAPVPTASHTLPSDMKISKPRVGSFGDTKGMYYVLLSRLHFAVGIYLINDKDDLQNLVGHLPMELSLLPCKFLTRDGCILKFFHQMQECLKMD